MNDEIRRTNDETNAWRTGDIVDTLNFLFVSSFELRPSSFIRGFEVSFFEVSR